VRKILAASTAAVLTLTGCGTDFWGNPTPEPSDDGSKCVAGPVAPPPPFDPAAQERPSGVTPGNSWIVFELEVRALSPAGSNDYCVPVAVHVYTRSGEADTVALDSKGMVAGPFDLRTTTPWTGRYVALQYDPTDERFAGRPPAYEVHLDATYLADRDTLNEVAPRALRCAIKLRGATVATDLVVVAAGSNVRCELRGNDAWIHG
jgi:hypothetical protein